MELDQEAGTRKAISWDSSTDCKVVNGAHVNFAFDFPKLESHYSFADLAKLQGLIDLEKDIDCRYRSDGDPSQDLIFSTSQ